MLIFFIACNLAEDLVTEKKAPEVDPIQSDKGFNIDPGDTIIFSVNATNPEEGSLSYEWSKQAGEFLSSNQESSVTWEAPISGGSYWIKVEVSNGDKTTSQTTDINVVSPENPFVRIIAPVNDDYLVQGTTVDIKFEAIHNNGISEVFVLINDSTIFSQPGTTQSEYSYSWNIFGPSGDTEIKIMARSNISDKIGADSINVTIEGILPGISGD